MMELPILYTGMTNHYEYFCRLAGLEPTEIRRISHVDHLYGYQHKLWLIDYGFDYLLHDATAMSYARQHDIQVLGVTLSNSRHIAVDIIKTIKAKTLDCA